MARQFCVFRQWHRPRAKPRRRKVACFGTRPEAVSYARHISKRDRADDLPVTYRVANRTRW